MEYLFLLSERFVFNLKQQFNNHKELTNYLSFDAAVITNSSFEITFSNSLNDKIICLLTTNPLDIPWSVQVRIIINSLEVGELNQWKGQNWNDEDPPYEVYPNLINDPSVKGNALALTIATDLIKFFEERKTV
jgi:hypothetical protein